MVPQVLYYRREMSTAEAKNTSGEAGPKAGVRRASPRAGGLTHAGRPARLSRKAVLEAALALADRKGLEALTMRRLAAELNCGVMTLYTHVRDRRDLLSGVVGLLIAEVETGHMQGSSWQEDVRRAASSYRTMALRHPRAFPALALAPSLDLNLRAHVRRIVDGLKEGGFDEATARELFSVIDSFGSGFLLMELSEPGEAEEDDPLEPLDEAAYWRGIELIIAGAERVLGV